MGIRFYKITSDKSERRIDRKLGGRTSVHSKILGIQHIHREIHLRSRRRRTTTVKVRTALSRPCPAGQTDNGQLFYNPDRIRTADRIETGKIRTDRHRTWFFTKFQTESGQTPDRKSGQNPDSRQTPDTIFRKIQTKRDKDRTLTVLSVDVSWGVFHNFTNVQKWLTLDWFIKSISSNISAKPASFLNPLNIFIIFFNFENQKIVRVKNSPNSTFLSLNRSTITLIITVYHPKIWATGFIGSDGDDFGTFLPYHMIHIYDPYDMAHKLLAHFTWIFIKLINWSLKKFWPIFQKNIFNAPRWPN